MIFTVLAFLQLPSGDEQVGVQCYRRGEGAKSRGQMGRKGHSKGATGGKGDWHLKAMAL